MFLSNKNQLKKICSTDFLSASLKLLCSINVMQLDMDEF